MTFIMPYEFDTSGTIKLILQGIVGLHVFAILPGLLYSLFVSRNVETAALLLLISAIAIYFGRKFLKNMPGSDGTIDTNSVVVQPGQIFGIQLTSPSGTFSVDQFSAVCVEVVFGASADAGLHSTWFTRVSLIGKAGVPDIFIERKPYPDGKLLGTTLAATLKLPYQEELKPY